MELVRSPEDERAQSYEHTEKRYRVVLVGQLFQGQDDRALVVRISNISAGGLMAVIPEGVELKESVKIAIRHIGTLAGRIVWGRNNTIGVRFDSVIDPEEMLAQRAQSARAPALQAQRFVDMNRAKLASRVAIAVSAGA